MSNIKMRRKKIKPLGSILKIKAELLLLGFTSVASWARQHGYVESTVREVLRRWSEASCEPLGGISRDIMKDMRMTLQDNLPFNLPQKK